MIDLDKKRNKFKQQINSNMYHGISDRRTAVRAVWKDDEHIKCTIKGNESIPVRILTISLEGIGLLVQGDVETSAGDKIVLNIGMKLSSDCCKDDIVCQLQWKSFDQNNITMGLKIDQSSFDAWSRLFKNIDSMLNTVSDRRKEKKSRGNAGLCRRKYMDSIEWSQYPLDINNIPHYKRSKRDRRIHDSKSSLDVLKDNRKKSNDRRKIKPDCGITNDFWIKSFKSIYTTIRDLLIFYVLPKWIISFLVGKGDFAFIAHPRDFDDVSRMFPFAKYLPVGFVKFWFKFQWPFIAARIERNSSEESQRLRGWLLIAPSFAEQMMRDTKLARKKIINTVKLAEKIGCKVAGLGAFTSIVTHDGRDVIGKTSIGVTTGNPFSAAVAVANLTNAMSLIGKSVNTAKVAIIGSAGSVGSGCSRALVEHVAELHLVDINEPALLQLYSELVQTVKEKKLKTLITKSKNLSRVSECDGVVVVTNTIKAIINDEHLKKGVIVVDCAQPKNVSFHIPKLRKDVLVIESAIVGIPGLECPFDLDVDKNEALGCMAESMLLSKIEGKKYVLGKVTAEQIRDIYKVSVDLGFQLAYFRNSCGYITEQDIINMRKVGGE